MSNPYVGEIRLFAGNFAPQGWAFCDGSLQSIANNDALFNLLGTTYGGDGVNTFALPNLLGRVPIHMGSNGGVPYVLGQKAGVETVTLTTSQIPAHTHVFQANAGGADSATGPAGTVHRDWADFPYSDQTTLTALSPSMIGTTGGSQPHSNLMPYVAIYYIISLFGVFPSQS